MAVETLQPGAGDDQNQRAEVDQLRNMWPDAPHWDFVTDGPADFDDEKLIHSDRTHLETPEHIAKTALSTSVHAVPGYYLG